MSSERDTHVYRLRDESGDLLYVGVAEHVLRRMAQHAREKRWWDEVVSITWETFGTRERALWYETRYIKAETPRYNIQSVRGGWWDLTAEYPELEEWFDALELDPVIARWSKTYDAIEDLLGVGTEDCDVAKWRLVESFTLKDA